MHVAWLTPRSWVIDDRFVATRVDRMDVSADERTGGSFVRVVDKNRHNEDGTPVVIVPYATSLPDAQDILRLRLLANPPNDA